MAECWAKYARRGGVEEPFNAQFDRARSRACPGERGRLRRGEEDDHGTDFECINDSLVGPSLFGFSMQDPGAAARIFKDFAKENEKFEVKALAVSGQMLGADQLDVLAKLPTRDQALSMLMSVMKAPVTKLVQTMNEVPGKLVRTLAAVRDQKEAAA